MDYSRFLNSISSAREPSTLRELAKITDNPPPGTVLLSGGIPNPETFPFVNITVGLKDGITIEMSGKKLIHALQYLSSEGYAPLVAYLEQLQQTLHNPPQWSNSSITTTCGSQDGICKTFEMILNEYDYVVMPEPIYCGALHPLKPYKVRYIAVESDSFGMIPDRLRTSLESLKKRGDITEKEFPKVIYINPTGTNPSGTSLPLERRKEIYKIAHDFDLLILEDDPYYFLQYDNEKLPSFLSMDVDGRVLRFDSFSKVISAGLRIGYVTGPTPLIERIVLHIQVSNFHPTSLSQVLMAELFGIWGISGFIKHAETVQQFYKRQRDWMVQCADKYLKDLTEYQIPNGGMFLWVKCLNVCNTNGSIQQKALNKKVVVVSGNHFMTDSSKPSSFLRISFSLSSKEEIDRGIHNLAELIREEQQLKN